MPLKKLAFSKATDANAPEIIKLVTSAYRGESSRAGWTTEADLVGGIRIDDATTIEKINQPSGAILLARDESGILVSCCEVQRKDADVGFFGMFAVDPLQQGGGMGRQVMAEAESYAKRTWGLKKLEMNVFSTRTELIDWYIRQGYEKTAATVPWKYDSEASGKALRPNLYFIVMEKQI